MLRRCRLIALVSVLALLLAGCTSLPQAGPVTRSDEQGGSESTASYIFNPPAPTQGATPEAIVTGFINAGSGIQDDFATAREYMTPEAAESWDPELRTVIYSSQPAVVASDAEGEYTVQFEIQGVVDDAGVLSQTSENSTEAITLRLVENEAGEWRVAEAPDGIILDSSQFNALYASHRLFFYDPSYSYAVPDVRWFLNRSGQTAEIVQSLMDGPAAYLDGAVATAFPDGAALSRASVPVSSGVAEVDLNASTLGGTEPLARQRMQQQLELTLTELARVSDVEMTMGQNPVDLGEEAEEFETVSTSASVGSLQVAISENNQLVYYEGAAVLPIAGAPDAAFLEPVDPTMSLDHSQLVFLNGERDGMYWATTQGQLDRVHDGENLTAPSLDHTGWAWTADRNQDDESTVTVARFGEEIETRTIDAAWLDQRRVEALRISPDGARVAVVVGDGDSNELFVAGVIRDESGNPVSIGNPISLETTVPLNDVVWYSTEELLVAATSATQRVVPELIGLNGTQASLNPLLGMTGFSAGAGSNVIYAETEEEVVLGVGSWWRPQSGVARDLSFPG